MASLPVMDPRNLRIDGFDINEASDCYVIAEIGHNHQGSIDTCKELFDEAKACGAHAFFFNYRENT